MTSATTSATPALRLTDVVAGYDHTTVLRGVSLTVPAGSVVALLGPNGAGKSTLLETVSGLVRPTSGSVQLFGDEVSTLSPNRRARPGLCHIPEGRGIYKRLTVRENLLTQADKGEQQMPRWLGPTPATRSSSSSTRRRSGSPRSWSMRSSSSSTAS